MYIQKQHRNADNCAPNLFFFHYKYIATCIILISEKFDER